MDRSHGHGHLRTELNFAPVSSTLSTPNQIESTINVDNVNHTGVTCDRVSGVTLVRMVKVAVVMPATIEDAGEFLADVRALEAAGAEIVGIEGDAPEQWVMLSAIAAVTQRIRIRVTGNEPGSLRRLSRGRSVEGTPPGETWREVPPPQDRDSWTAMLRDLEAAGVVGIVVPWDPRLIDLLRNPDADDRSDLLMSTG